MEPNGIVAFEHVTKNAIRDFFAILGRGPRVFPFGKISDVNPEFGKFSKYSKLIILPS